MKVVKGRNPVVCSHQHNRERSSYPSHYTYAHAVHINYTQPNSLWGTKKEQHKTTKVRDFFSGVQLNRKTKDIGITTRDRMLSGYQLCELFSVVSYKDQTYSYLWTKSIAHPPLFCSVGPHTLYDLCCYFVWTYLYLNQILIFQNSRHRCSVGPHTLDDLFLLPSITIAIV